MQNDYEMNIVENTSSQFPVLQNIPPHRKKLLFISYGKPHAHGYGMEFNIGISDKAILRTVFKNGTPRAARLDAA